MVDEPDTKLRQQVLKLKVGCFLTGPDRRGREDLLAVALALNVARNRAARAWQRWHEDNPPGEGEPLQLPFSLPHPDEPKTTSIQNWLYHQCCQAAPLVNSGLCGAAAKEVLKFLKTKTEDSTHWRKVLAGEMNLATFRELSVPVMNNFSVLCYQGIDGNGAHVQPEGTLRRLVMTHGRSGCALGFPLFSRTSGRNHKALACRLDVSKLTEGHKTILRRIASGQWKLGDSHLKFRPARPNARCRRPVREEGDWWLHLNYSRPETVCRLNSSRVAVLTANGPDINNPFTVESDGCRPWGVGRGRLLCCQFAPHEARRRVLRQTYEVDGHGPRGHGHKRFFRDIKPVTRKLNDMANDVLCKTASEVVRFCERHDCGILVWQAPPLARRQYLWAAVHHVPWDWTGFEHRLRDACADAGVVIAEEDPRQSVKTPERKRTRTRPRLASAQT